MTRFCWRSRAACLFLAAVAGCGGGEKPETRSLLSHANALRADDWPARVAAVERCAADPTPGAVRVFCTAGHDPDDRVRLTWDRAIDHLADREGVEWLLRAGLTHPDRAVRYAAWRRWLTPPIPPDAVAKALPWLEDNFEEIQALALERLGSTGDPAILNAARFLVRPRYPPRVRLRAAALLGVPREAGFVNAGLCAVVEGTMAGLREGVDGVEGPPPAFPPPDFTFERAVERLGDGLRDPAAISLLAEIASNAGTQPGRTPSTAYRSAKQAEMAIRMLHRSRQSESGLTLLTLARDGAPASIRREAIAALADVDHPIRDERLIDLLRATTDPEVRLSLAWAMRSMESHSPAITAAMAEAAKGESDWRVKAALECGAEVPHVGQASPPAPRGAGEDARATVRRGEAISEALAWLCRTQEVDGHWDAVKWNPYAGTLVFPGLRGSGTPDEARAVAAASDPGVTALALLSLVGTGGRVRDDTARVQAVRHAGKWLSEWYGRQAYPFDATIGPKFYHAGYQISLVRWALAEWMGREIGRAASRALDRDRREEAASALNDFRNVSLWRGWPEHVKDSLGDVVMDAPGFGIEHLAFETAAIRAATTSPDALDRAIDDLGGAIGQETGLAESPSRDPWAGLAVVRELRRSAKEWMDVPGKQSSDFLGRCAAAHRNGAIPSDPGGTFWYSGLGSSARAVVLAKWLGVPLGTGGNAEASKWLGGTCSPDVATLAHLSLHRPVWEPYFEIVGPQKTVPDPLWPFPRTEELAANGVSLFSSWEDDIVDMDYSYWGALAADAYRDESWAKGWSASLERVLLAEQRQAGAERGSWDPEGPWERVTGRVGATALGAMALEVPDRPWGMQR